MVATVTQITTGVRIALGLDARPEPLLPGSPETMDLERLIRRSIVPAARKMLAALPVEALAGAGCTFADAPVRWLEPDLPGGVYRRGVVRLPDDFFRLISFRMSGWRRAWVPGAEGGGSACISRYGAHGGNPWRPECRLVPTSDGLLLEFASCADTGAVITEAGYLPAPEIDRHGGIELPRHTLSTLVDMIADTISTKLDL